MSIEYSVVKVTKHGQYEIVMEEKNCLQDIIIREVDWLSLSILCYQHIYVTLIKYNVEANESFRYKACDAKV